MRQHLATLAPAFLVGGCSLIYNPNNITSTDAAIDAMVDANPANLVITGVESPALLEGQGDEGSRPAVLVVRGMNIINGATITIAPTAGTALVEVVETPVVSSQSDLIAVKVIARVDTSLAANGTRDLVVTVTQPSPLGGMVQGTAMWQLVGLNELAGAAQTIDTAMVREYSRVAVDTLSYSGTGKVIVRATASISVTGPINVSAVTTNTSATPGPGGFPGGGVEGEGMGPGLGKAGVAGSQGGGGAGFVTAGQDGGNNPTSGGPLTGDVLITRYAINAGSGGGGADGFGGAGGGTLELSAGGNLTVNGAISADGSAGKGGTVLAAGGGGGSGGVVVLRSGGTATVSGITVAGGAGGVGTLLVAAGGAGRTGRARIDAAAISGDLGPAHRGVMFDSTVPVIVRSASPTLEVLGSATDRFDIQRANTSHAPLGAKNVIDFGGATSLAAPVPTLEPGFNRVCIVPENGGLGNPESRNCADLAYLP